MKRLMILAAVSAAALTSAEGVGTTVTVRLPVTADA